MSILYYFIDEETRKLRPEAAHKVVAQKDHNADVIRVGIPETMNSVDLETSAVRCMYQRPKETEVRSKTATYYDTSGGYLWYDWTLQEGDTARAGKINFSVCLQHIEGGLLTVDWNTTIGEIFVKTSYHSDDSDEGDETITPTVAERVAVLETMIQRVASGAPIVVASTSAMTDTDQIYVLKTDEKWYYYNDSAWVAGGTYGAVATDSTLTQANIPADAAAVGAKIEETKSELNYFTDTQAKRFYPTWESGSIDGTTGADTTGNATRCVEYIDKSTIANFTVNTHSGALYIYRYEYDVDSETYSYLGKNQRTGYGNFTNWLKGLTCTHFRVWVGSINATPDEWLYIGVSNTISTNISKAVSDAQSAINNSENVRYWRHTYTVEPGTTHSAISGEVPVSIPAGYSFSIKEKLNIDFNRQFYAYYSDGTSERLYNYVSSSEGHIARNVIVPAKEKDITSFSVYINNNSGTVAHEISCEIFVEKSLSGYEEYTHQTSYWIQNEDCSLTCFEVGRARELVQAIAVVNNEVWEFAQGKARYNGIEYSLDNGHGNNCNWGTILHGTYPYLYCPTWTKDEMNINVFSFDGTTFTKVDTIHFGEYTGYLDAYVDDGDGFIYGFVFANNAAGKCHYFVSDLEGNVLLEKDLPYLIRTIQGICMHDGLIYAVSGYGNTASPNYLYKISPDGTLISKNVMGRIGYLGEIEGIDFLDNEMILATYYNFYIHPHRVPRVYRMGHIKQLEASE